MAARNLRGAVRRMADALPADQGAEKLSIVVLCRVADAGGREPGLYRDRRPGSAAGVYVYDPAGGPAAPPGDMLAPHALVIGGEAAPDEYDFDGTVRVG